MEKKCPFCGELLPEEAAFCPRCAKSVNQRDPAKKPHPTAAKILKWILPVFLAAAVLAVFFLYSRPKTYEGMGSVTYTDKEGSYQLLLHYFIDQRYSPLAEFETVAGTEERYRFPLWLYVNRQDTGEDAADAFMEKLESASVHIEQPDSPSPIQCTDPEPMELNPGAALGTLIDFTRESESPAQIIYTLNMKNGDTIRLGMELTIKKTAIYNFSPEDTDLSDSKALQALIDWAEAETEPEDSVNVLLPAVTYTEPIVLRGRAINLTGSEEDGKRTTFTAGIQMQRDDDANFWISYFTGIDFTGDGSGVAISAASRLWTKECRFSNWKTAILGFGNVWVNTTDCTFENNGVGLHYNSDNVSPSDSHFTGNRFTGNDTAVLLDKVPADVVMDFGGCTFSGNRIDIDNRCGQPLDTSQTVFESQ